MTTPPTRRAFLVLHGWQNHRPAGHWHHWLAGRLTELGQEVDYPQLPDADHPDLDRWLTELRTRLDPLHATGRDVTVICHSLACALWLHAAARDAVHAPVHRVLLVAPPSASFLHENPEVAAFVPPLLTPADLAGVAAHTRVVASDNDPVCPEGALAAYGTPLGLSVDILQGAGHVTPDSGYGPWPSVLNWCLSTSTETPVQDRAGS